MKCEANPTLHDNGSLRPQANPWASQFVPTSSPADARAEFFDFIGIDIHKMTDPAATNWTQYMDSSLRVQFWSSRVPPPDFKLANMTRPTRSSNQIYS